MSHSSLSESAFAVPPRLSRPLSSEVSPFDASPPDDAPATCSEERLQQLVSPYAPFLVLNPEGFIEHLTDAARHLLQYRSDQEVDAYFFTHVHGKNQRRVMRDLAGMVRHGEARASWLLRLRTGRGHWRWYRAEAEHRSTRETNGEASSVIVVRLRDWYDW